MEITTTTGDLLNLVQYLVAENEAKIQESLAVSNNVKQESRRQVHLVDNIACVTDAGQLARYHPPPPNAGIINNG